MKISELAELINTIGVALAGLGASLKGLAELIKATKKEPKQTIRPRKFK